MRLRIEFEIDGELAEALESRLAMDGTDIDEVMRALVDLYCGMPPKARWRLPQVARHDDWLDREMIYRDAGRAMMRTADEIDI